ncbi:MAG: ribonuclease H-like domain-containing protein [Tissierellia bacterium]|nr:ribonuclease H-like domain-containing protein [Tissierellia bacterium]
MKDNYLEKNMIINCTELTNNIVEDKNINEFFKEAFFFDIETTGLSHKYSRIISISVLLFENKTFRIYQLFCEHKTDEKEMIKYFREYIKNRKYIITYNGNTFDIPFIINKAMQFNINCNLNEFVKIDLYSEMRYLKNKINIENLKLKTVEEYFNIKRKDTINGQDVIILYEAFRIDPRKEFSTLILQHNYEDVYNLPLLFKNIINLYDQIIIYPNIIIKINYFDFIFKKNSLLVNIHIITDYKNNIIHHNINFDLKIDITSQLLTINIPISYFQDEAIKELYYINNEDYNISRYTSLKGLKKNLIPLKFNGEILNNNIFNILKKIFNTIF